MKRNRREVDETAYIDEYRFVPMTPWLESRFKAITDSLPCDGDGENDTSVAFKVEEGSDYIREFEALGLVVKARDYIGGADRWRLTQIGGRYWVERAAYGERKASWAAARASEAERAERREVLLALTGLGGALAGAVIGAVSTLVASGLM